jgi:hypothetical protein
MKRDNRKQKIFHEKAIVKPAGVVMQSITCVTNLTAHIGSFDILVHHSEVGLFERSSVRALQ